MNKKSGQEVAKQKTTFAKTDARYWKPRLFQNTYTRNGERHALKSWCIRLSHGGRRETINFHTPNQTVAATRAAQAYKMVIAEGWAAVLEAWKPEIVTRPATVGEFIAAASAVCMARPATIRCYVGSLRLIVSESEKLTGGKSRFNGHQGGGAAKWRARIDSLPLASLTPAKVQAWRVERLRAAGENPVTQRSAKTTINTTIRQAKTLFSPKILRHIDASLELPPNPFEGVEFFERASMRYVSKIDTRKLIETAKEELGQDAERFEEWKAFVLLMFAGLRKNELDKLRWESVDFTAGILRIEDHDGFKAKCEASKDAVELDREIVAMLRGWRADDPEGLYVLRSRATVRVFGRLVEYRAAGTFERLGDWLKTQGITARKPIHELRKEAGSIVAQRHGIYAASRFLRHSDISITSAHCVDKKERVTVGLGGLLGSDGGPENVTAFPTNGEQESNQGRKRA